jgi:hypothetical protein
MGKRLTPLFTIAAAVFLTATVFSVAAGQEAATPDADVERHPAHIHSGTCEDIGDVVFPLNDLQAASAIATPGASPSAMEGETAAASPEPHREPVAQSGSVVDAPLDAILEDEHVINVHESPDNMGTFIACGELTGTPGDGELTIALNELNDSGLIGEAILTDMGDGTTTVHVSLFPSDTMVGTPEATPAS